MRYLYLLLIPLAAFSNHYYIQQPVVNMFSKATEDTDAVSQVTYGTEISVLENKDGFYKIQAEDGYEGWVLCKAVLQREKKIDDVYPIKNLYAHVYRVGDTIPYPPVMTLTFGSCVKVLDKTPQRWLPIELVDGRKAFIQKGDLELEPKVISLNEMLSLSKKFLGLPYTWAGKSSLGYDCSGFVQMLYKQMGVMIPRDSRPQAASDQFKSVEKENLLPGDLVFFGEKRIGHVALYIGDNKIIHPTVAVGGPKVAITDVDQCGMKYICARRLK